MALIPLEDFKAHCRIESYVEDSDQDKNLAAALDAAELYVFTAINGDMNDYVTDQDLPRDLRWAIMAVGAHFFAHPEPTESAMQQTVPFSIEAILKPYWQFKEPKR